ncbi:hypothetical protein Tco_0660654, partial [Tanacetum coccineum]
SHEAPLSEGNTSRSAEDSLQLKELMAIIPKMVTQINSLEKELKETKQTLRNVVLTLVKKGRKIQHIDDDSLVSLVRESMKEKEADFVTPTKASALGEAQKEDISPTILEAAQTLSQVVSQSVSTYKRRARSANKGKEISTGLDFFSAAKERLNSAKVEVNTEVNYGSAGVNTGNTPVSTPSVVQTVNVIIPSPVKDQREGKAPMTAEDIQATQKTKAQIEQEKAGLAEAMRLQALQDEEAARQDGIAGADGVAVTSGHYGKVRTLMLGEEALWSTQRHARKLSLRVEIVQWCGVRGEWSVVGDTLAKMSIRGDAIQRDGCVMHVVAGRHRTLREGFTLVSWGALSGSHRTWMRGCGRGELDCFEFQSSVVSSLVMYGVGWYQVQLQLEHTWIIYDGKYCGGSIGGCSGRQVWASDLGWLGVDLISWIGHVGLNEEERAKGTQVTETRVSQYRGGCKGWWIGVKSEELMEDMEVGGVNYLLSRWVGLLVRLVWVGIYFGMCWELGCDKKSIGGKYSGVIGGYVVRIGRYLGGGVEGDWEIHPQGGCQFLGKRLISWQCKKQTIVANSTTEAEYVAAANCCGQVLWIQNQMLDYGFNFMNTKIYIDNESTICIVKNPVFHSKTKHIEIRHHFIRDSYEKMLIQVIKIHTDHNVADLLTKAFDVSRKAIRTTEISQSSGPINLVVDETVYEEWEDRMERATTTASSLDAEQDSGSGPRCHVTILGDANAQTRIEAASK